MTHKEKILVFVAKTGLNKTQFCKKCGLSNGYLDSKGSITSDKLAAILENFRELSLDWLLFNKGEMLLTSQQEAEKSQNKTLFDFSPEEKSLHIFENPEIFENNTTYQKVIKSITNEGVIEGMKLVLSKMQEKKENQNS